MENTLIDGVDGPEEAIPLVIFNEEKKCKYTLITHLICLVLNM